MRVVGRDVFHAPIMGLTFGTAQPLISLAVFFVPKLTLYENDNSQKGATERGRVLETYLVGGVRRFFGEGLPFVEQ